MLDNQYSGSSFVSISEYIWRIFNLKQMDFQYTCSQMVLLCIDPHQVYKSTKFRKMTKNQWARDDPSFILLICYFIIISSLSFSISFGTTGILHFIRLVLGSCFIEFLLSGCLISTLLWFITNKYMIKSRALSSERSQVEWLYAFDIHCNSFFPSIILLYIIQYFLSPLLINDNFISLFVANSLYAFSFAYYMYITFLGYSILPFIHNPTKLLMPIALIFIFLPLSLILHKNMSYIVFHAYFGYNPSS